MKIERVKKMPVRKRFFYWIRERNQIRLRKEELGLERPWTDDEVLANNYFTNIRREDDRVTRWFAKNIRGPLSGEPEVVFATIAFRWFNLPSTGEYMLKKGTHKQGAFVEWDLDDVKSHLHGIKDHGAKVFTGAFNISNSGSTKPKIDRVCDDYIQPVWEIRRALYFALAECCTMQNAFRVVKKLPGLGGSGFMAAQVLCDLAYTHVLSDAPDWWTWCSWGPGSKRGMNRVFGHDEKHSMPRAAWDTHLHELRREIEVKLGLQLHARDVQNCLCEFSKYERGLEGTRLKRRYPSV